MIRPLVIVSMLVVMIASGPAARGQHPGFGQGNWGGSSFTVGRSTFYANGLVANRVGNTSYYNNGLVSRDYGKTTIYTNGLLSARFGRNTYYSNAAVGVPIRGGMVYGGGYPYPMGPGPLPFGGPASAPQPSTPWAVKPWDAKPWGR
jgi:hypothetical protein